ncbi:hypothetical protein DL96DRAFT_1614624 [Flagelloscypha sp. PMI_526]|nr:hypothetical protein DL96DRAFT_1614624 [Flagelloscypha sp. PMI_526]
MHSRSGLALLFAATVLAKKGGAGSVASRSGPLDWVTLQCIFIVIRFTYFWQDPFTLSDFVLGITYGTLTLGGGFWLAKHYNGVMTGRLQALCWFTWFVWSLSLLFYVLGANLSVRIAQFQAGYDDHDYVQIDRISFAVDALERLDTAAWLIVLLAHTYTVWKTSKTEIDRPSRPHFLFYATLVFLALSALLGGIVAPMLEGIRITDGRDDDAKIIPRLYITYTAFILIAACLLLATVLITQKRTRETEGNHSINPLRWIILIVVPLWIITELVCFVLDRINDPILFNARLLLFGIASLATIAVLPSAVVNRRKHKTSEA